MGLFDSLKKKAGEKQESSEARESANPEAKFDKPCSYCGKQPTEVQWMGQYWHKACRRKAKKMVGKMM